MKFLTIFLSSIIFLKLQAQPSLTITNFGAMADGKTINTKFIQSAIDSCNKIGGGTVYIPSGVFMTGFIQLRSNVQIYLAAGAVLKGSASVADYTVGKSVKGMFYGEDLVNVSFAGEGEINGNSDAFFNVAKQHNYIDFDKHFVRQGQAFFDALLPADGPVFYAARPDMTLVIMHSQQIKITGIRFVNAPSWTMRIGDCEDVLIDGISIANNPLIPNSDGIHLTTSRLVRVANCNIIAGDDALIVTGFGDDINMDNASDGKVKKTYQYGNKTGIAENIVATNCIFKSNSAGIRVGYGKGNMRNLIFSNIIIHQSNRGVLINTREEGSVDNVLFNNFIINAKHLGGTWWGRGEPIHISSYPISKGINNGTISNIRFSNMHIVAETGIVVWANEMGKVKNLTFDNLSIKINNSNYVTAFGGNIDLRPTTDIATNIFKRDLPAFLLYNVDGVKLKTVSNIFNGKMPAFYTYGLEVADSKNVVINDCDFTPASNVFVPVFIHKSLPVKLKK
ncbi:MAG: hypothetical protein EAZ13_03710 [Sphingobacteriia bacterium]|nr:MAG: hypothetical protein EAZ41_06520 [Sphingobacteriia bacterium]TAG31082.1 MAG: hypothetical protein EAZ35_04995 [Sphingobacteriia bacterium]TAH08382.1 MAG: hypothetical protein EAZ13_03710 [Sphingobacteriia bacterium]